MRGIYGAVVWNEESGTGSRQLFVAVTSDNGASQEGGPTGVMDEFKFFNGVPEDVDAIQGRLHEIGGPHSHSNYPWGWAQAGNTPLKWYKQNTFGGGVRDPLVVDLSEPLVEQADPSRAGHALSAAAAA